MIQELTITNTKIQENDGKGNLLFTSTGKQYKRLSIQVDYVDYDGKWLSKLVFGPEDKCLQLKKGDRVKLKITPNGQYLNFDLPGRADFIEEELRMLTRRVEQLELLSRSPSVKKESTIEEKVSGPWDNPEPKKEEPKADIPW